MKRNALFRRGISLLLTLALLLGAVPAALAENAVCPACGSKNCTKTVAAAANCHEKGSDRYVCGDCRKTTQVETDIDPNNHDGAYTANSDGLTHSVQCSYDGYSDPNEPHTFADGRCTKCGAADYSQVKFSLPQQSDIYVNLGDTAAALSVGDIRLTAGDLDITDEYNLSYSWYYCGSLVGSGASYLLPAASAAAEADYEYVCFIMATSKKGAKSLNASCTVAVHVRELIEAYAAVSTEDTGFTLGGTNSRNSVSVADQIYDKALAVSGDTPSYVVFGPKPASRAGDLTNMTPGTSYYFSGEHSLLADLHFMPDKSNTGVYVVNYTIYDSRKTAYPGTLTITVERSLGSMGALYTTAKGSPVSLRAEDFAAFWRNTYPQGTLTWVSFTELPPSSQGTLYSGYTSTSRPGVRIGAQDTFYAAAKTDQGDLNSVTFVPNSGYAGYVVIPFKAYGQNNRGVSTYLTSSLCVFINESTVPDVICSAAAGSAAKLQEADFLSVCQSVTGSKDAGFYIQLLEVPASGALYLNDTGSGRDVKLTAASLASHPLYCDGSHGDRITSVTYLPGESSSESVRYAAYSAKGALLYVGAVRFGQETPAISFTDVKSGDWFYTYVMDLAKAGIISGSTPTAYRPSGEVTYGQALKLVLLAAGYSQQAPTGKHWASGYLAAAVRDSLLPDTVTEADLDRKIDRYTIAALAAKALHLPKSALTASPFSDMKITDSAAPYVLALYEAKIVEGSKQSGGDARFNGSQSIRRSEMAAIVWRISNYKK